MSKNLGFPGVFEVGGISIPAVGFGPPSLLHIYHFEKSISTIPLLSL
jgi:hypothetical protein